MVNGLYAMYEFRDGLQEYKCLTVMRSAYTLEMDIRPRRSYYELRSHIDRLTTIATMAKFEAEKRRRVDSRHNISVDIVCDGCTGTRLTWFHGGGASANDPALRFVVRERLVAEVQFLSFNVDKMDLDKSTNEPTS